MFRYRLAMKADGAALSDDEVFTRVAATVQKLTGLPPEHIDLKSRVAEDLGLWGDDGWDLIERLDEEFQVDWEGFDGGIHYGWEGFGPPLLPWHVSRSPFVFEPQPLILRDLVQAIRERRWPGTPRIPAPLGRRLSVHAASWALFVMVTAPLVAVVVMGTMSLIER